MPRLGIVLLMILLVGCSQPVQTLIPVAPSPSPSDLPGTAVQTPTSANTPAAPPTSEAMLSPTITPISNEMDLKLIGQLGGEINSVAIQGAIAFIGQGARLVALDISNSANIKLAGQSQILPGNVDSLILRENTAYATAGRYLVILDIADVTNIKLQGQVELPANGKIIIQNKVAYVGGLISKQYDDVRNTSIFESYIATVDISAEPQLINSVTVPYSFGGLALKGNILYMLEAEEKGIITFDVTNSHDVEQIGSITNIPYAYSIRVFDNTALIGGYYEVEAYDISDPLTFKFRWKVEGDEIGQVYDFILFRSQLYTQGQQALGAYEPANTIIKLPEQVTDNSDYLSATHIAIGTNGSVYLTNSRTLGVYSVQGTSLAYANSYNPPSGGDLIAENNELLVGYRLGAGYIAKYSLPDLGALNQLVPTHLTGVSTNQVSTLSSSEDYLYLTGDQEFRIYTENDLTPVSETHFDDAFPALFQQSSRHVSIPIVQNIAYLYGAYSELQEAILRYDVTNPSKPELIDTMPFDNYLRVGDIGATSNWLVVALYSEKTADEGWLAVYDVNRSTPQAVGEIQLHQVLSEIQISQNLLFAGTGGSSDSSSQLQIYSLPDLSLLSTVDMPSIYEIGLSDNLAYLMTKENNQLFVVDFADNLLPRIKGMFDIGSSSGDIALNENYIVVGNEHMGIYVFQRTQEP